ncbi:hypothetical protein GB937_007904 [Aspergillus fischeri]|nr:hypothetical protein GB937_007904 [Aspergillus fischeri]
MVCTLRVQPTSETFEKHPPTYTSLKLIKNPSAGGDTLFISSYGLYERLSEPWRKFAESLTGKRNIQPTAPRNSKKCIKQDCLNFNPTLRASTPFPRYDILTIPVSPVVRTNPVTGWKGLYGMAYGIRNGGFDNLAKHESDTADNSVMVVHYMICNSSDLQIRRRWKGLNGIALWDKYRTPSLMISILHTELIMNRLCLAVQCFTHLHSMFCPFQQVMRKIALLTSSSDDFDEERLVFHISVAGERPYYDPASSARSSAI